MEETPAQHGVFTIGSATSFFVSAISVDPEGKSNFVRNKLLIDKEALIPSGIANIGQFFFEHLGGGDLSQVKQSNLNFALWGKL